MDIRKQFDETKEYFFEEGCFIIEMLNDENHPELSIARARVEAGKTTRLHKLLGTTERYIMQSGTGEVTVGEEPAFIVNAGDVVVIPPDTAQKIKNTGNQDLIFLVVCTPRFTPENYQDIDISN